MEDPVIVHREFFWESISERILQVGSQMYCLLFFEAQCRMEPEAKIWDFCKIQDGKTATVLKSERSLYLSHGFIT